MTTWPSTLPSPLLDKFRETAPDTALRTSMDTGPAKVRQRTTAGVRGLSLAWLLDKTQVAALDSFYGTDLAGGSYAFDFTHPRTGETVSCRFKAPPAYAPSNGVYFFATAQLEVLP